MELAGYLASLLIGVSLGLIGGGGSILTVPVLVYLFLVPPPLAISYSLFIVGITSLTGAYKSYRKGHISIRTALLFGSSSLATVVLIRKFIVPLIPDVILNTGSFIITQDALLMVIFALLMIAASFSMIRSKKESGITSAGSNTVSLIFYGVLIGSVTGFLGAGGGFLLIPALVLVLKLPMRTAVGTSLLIIALNSLTGFFAGISYQVIDWNFLVVISAIAIAGILIGGYFNQKIDPVKLKKGFGWFVLFTGIAVILAEVLP